MKITSVKVRRILKENSRIRGFASVVLDECFVVTNIRVIEGERGLFIAMPSRRKADGEFEDIAHPITQECRSMFEREIFDAYEKADEVDLNATRETSEVAVEEPATEEETEE